MDICTNKTFTHIFANIFTYIFSKRQKSIDFYKYSISRLNGVAHYFFIFYTLINIYSDLRFWSVDHALIYENSELKVFKNRIIFYDFYTNWPHDLLGANVYKSIESSWWSCLTILQWSNTTSVIFEWSTFVPFLSFIILLLVPVSNFFVSGVKSSR